MRISDWSSDVCSSDPEERGDQQAGDDLDREDWQVEQPRHHVGLQEEAGAADGADADGEGEAAEHDHPRDVGYGQPGRGIDPAFGRAVCRESGARYGSITVAGGTFQYKYMIHTS